MAETRAREGRHLFNHLPAISIIVDVNPTARRRGEGITRGGGGAAALAANAPQFHRLQHTLLGKPASTNTVVSLASISTRAHTIRRTNAYSLFPMLMFEVNPKSPRPQSQRPSGRGKAIRITDGTTDWRGPGTLSQNAY